MNARHTKNLPGRNSNVQESQWWLKLHTCGLLSDWFQPPVEIRVLRTYWRQRGEHVAGAATCTLRMQKVLTQMNLQPANVISDISGLAGQTILRAVLAGERDPGKLGGGRRVPHLDRLFQNGTTAASATFDVTSCPKSEGPRLLKLETGYLKTKT